MKRRTALAFALLSAVSAADVHGAEGALVPLPASITRHSGAFEISAGTAIVIAAGDRAAGLAAPVLAERLARSRHVALSIAEGAPRDGAIVFERDRARGEGDESYRLDVTPRRITLRAGSLAGYANAATTLWQLAESGPIPGARVPAVAISDAPRFAWRGLLLDSARHYQSPDFILRFIDTMAAHKLNVLHWHLTDDQGWRLEIRRYPKLTSVGAWRVPAGAAHADIDPATGKPRLHGGYYTQEQARRIVSYAAARGVAIVPEIEMPGHASAVLAAYPQFATVQPAPTEVPADWGVFANVLNLEEPTLAFLEDVLTEVMEIFPSPYIHIGGDEVDTSQWKASPRVRGRMRELGIADEGQIQHWLTRRIGRFLAQHGRRLVGWDEILQPDLPRGAIVMSWRGTKGAIAAAAQGHDAVMAVDPDLYFDHRQSVSPDEPPGRMAVVSTDSVYRFVPEASSLGLQGNLWSEHIRTEGRMGWMAFPRAAAIAEVGWTQPQFLDAADFRRRLAAMPARYDALGMTYAKTVFEPKPDAPANAFTRASHELETCGNAVPLWLEDDAPTHGRRARFLVDILNPCWVWRGARLDGVRRIAARVGQVPFNFQVGAEKDKVTFESARTPEGELVVRRDTCEGEVIARLPLAPAKGSDTVTALPATRVEPSAGVHDLCLRFAQRGVDPLWVLDRVRMETAP
jgi:hexosaminidase